MTYILSLTDPGATLEKVGGKGASLARLSAAGFTVPSGFHITTSAYNDFINENHLLVVIQEWLERKSLDEPANLEEASHHIRKAFEQSTMPSGIAQEIVQAYTRLSEVIPGTIESARSLDSASTFPIFLNTENPPVAIRSSATAEDLPEASFAGQQETFLNIRGQDALLIAVKRCWGSLWTARAIAYRARQNISHESVSMAVIVQLLVPARAAGILFTVDPVTGDRNHLVINASWGLGEAVVGGLVTPDTLVVDKSTGVVISRHTAEKQVMTVTTINGTSELPIMESMKGAPVLDDSDALRLASLGSQVESLYGVPMDIEWALADGQYHLLQARPITALPEPQIPERAGLAPSSLEPVPTSITAPTTSIEWNLPNPKGIYMRGSVVDILPDPLSPLFETMGIPSAMKGIKSVGFEMTRSKPLLSYDYFTTINHYAYMDGNIPARSWWWILTGLLPSLPRIFRNGHHFLQEESRPRYLAVMDKWHGKSLEETPVTELWEGANQVLDAAMFYLCTMMFATMGASAGSEMLFTRIYSKWAQKEGDPSAPIFLMGYDSIPIQAEKSLFDLAMWAKEREVMTSYILMVTSDEIAARMEERNAPKEIPNEDWEAFRNLFQSHLERYGHTIYNLDFAHPLPIDHPQPLLETVKMYLLGEGTNPHERQCNSEQKRVQAVETVLGRTKGFRRWAFQKSLGWAQSLSEIRESALADIGLGYPLLRKMMHEIGNRFVQARVIHQSEDIYWLEREEIQGSLAALECGENLSAKSELIQQRKDDRKAIKEHTPPPMLPPKERIMGIKTDIYVAASESEQVGDTLKGVAASAGRVSAAACVLRGPEDFHQMKIGLVLVAATTTPAWTPLFAMASGVVTDIGGPLSHGSIVAREYGIPAVMGTGVATRRIQNGQVITVDGDVGTVILTNTP